MLSIFSLYFYLSISLILSLALFLSLFISIFHSLSLSDLLGYRKYGHNEGDEARFTQPKLYKSIGSLGKQILSFKKILLYIIGFQFIAYFLLSN